jgi:NADPH2:quinone reductase
LFGSLGRSCAGGKIVSEPKQVFALEDAAEAHRALESRSTSGATVLAE